MATPRRWTIAGLILLATCSLTIVDVVLNFKAHGREDSQIMDCKSSLEDHDTSDVPGFFVLMVMTKISMALMQLGVAFDCFNTADMRLKGSNDHDFPLLFVSIGLYYVLSFTVVILLTGTSTTTDCFSCCLAHERVIVYLIWTIPSLLLVAATAVVLLLFFLLGFFGGLKNFLNLLFRSFTYEAVSKPPVVEVV